MSEINIYYTKTSNPKKTSPKIDSTPTITIEKKKQIEIKSQNLPKLKPLTQEDKTTTAMFYLILLSIVLIEELNSEDAKTTKEIIKTSMSNLSKTMKEKNKELQEKAKAINDINTYELISDIARYLTIAISLTISAVAASTQPWLLLIPGLDCVNEICKKTGIWDKIGSLGGIGYMYTKLNTFAASVFAGLSLVNPSPTTFFTCLQLSSGVATGIGAIGESKSRQQKLKIDSLLFQKEELYNTNLNHMQATTQGLVNEAKRTLNVVTQLKLVITLLTKMGDELQNNNKQ